MKNDNHSNFRWKRQKREESRQKGEGMNFYRKNIERM